VARLGKLVRPRHHRHDWFDKEIRSVVEMFDLRSTV
jgi:hypothetical protein